MKKVFGIILAVCLIAMMLCVAVFAAEAPASDVVLRVSATTKDGSTVVVKDYTSFEDGWNAAMELASTPEELNKNEYGRIIVDLYSDWNAVDGEFTDDFFNGAGFEWDAIYIPQNVKVTLNLNGHKIQGNTSNVAGTSRAESPSYVIISSAVAFVSSASEENGIRIAKKVKTSTIRVILRNITTFLLRWQFYRSPPNLIISRRWNLLNVRTTRIFVFFGKKTRKTAIFFKKFYFFTIYLQFFMPCATM